ncbi:uncharacterized protein TRIVIDRAFT_39631 [Trichoderma virens Gv29-8]|uniref:Short-chain dehydrogenase/reductase n=1 Tax=Hypocrea virens (strain Gv29-8 / FGSC 10586) TaxID=413071 RepID=G9NBV3_HYPVG|nr:uncharacterized protein TRIVIDRAFT_39631 [Trichoderma virens Gv29-8]EHK16306.1 hypothetical protein TRIVIDRAFT_39631 [Trichoderma virens Gv29-8]UKZ55919.1 hypothetical protein TrVGV298_009743 [Trichoderma virens]
MKGISLDTVRTSNATLKTLGPGLLAVFVGGTSGIGESILKAFLGAAVAPRVYIIGRSRDAANRIVKECQAVSETSEVEFLQADVSEIANVDQTCSEILRKETRLNLLVLTTGILTMDGRNESPEGLDRKMAVHYYSRMRFISNLLPLLASSASSSQLSRVMTVLGAGIGNRMVESDLGLKTNFSLSNCGAHCGVMTDLMLERFAATWKGTAFVHTAPGVVKTNLGSGLPTCLRAAYKVAGQLLAPWTVGLAETGERHLYMATSNRYPPSESLNAATCGTPIEKNDVAEGSNGGRGSGAYLLNWDGRVQKQNANLLEEYRRTAMAEKIWKHTEDVFDNCNRGGNS